MIPEKYTDAYLELMVKTYNRYEKIPLFFHEVNDWYVLRCGEDGSPNTLISEGDIESITDRVHQILKENGLLEFME